MTLSADTVYLLAKLKIFKIPPKPKSQLDKPKSQTGKIPIPIPKSQTYPKSQTCPKSQSQIPITNPKSQSQIPNPKSQSQIPNPNPKSQIPIPNPKFKF